MPSGPQSTMRGSSSNFAVRSRTSAGVVAVLARTLSTSTVSDVAVGVIKVGRCERGGEGELLSVGREDRAAVGSFERDDFVDGVVVSEVGDVDVFFAAKREERICGRRIGDQSGIGRPGKAGNVELFVVRDLARFRGQEIRLRGGDIDGPDLTLLVIFLEDFVVAVFFFAIFVCFRFDWRMR